MTGIVIGIGCRATCSFTTLQTLVDQLLQQIESRVFTLHAIGCWSRRQHHEGVIALAHMLGVPLEAWSSYNLALYEEGLSHRSPQLYHHTGLWGIAEAAALASASMRLKASAQLLVPRHIAETRDATGAIAQC